MLLRDISKSHQKKENAVRGQEATRTENNFEEGTECHVHGVSEWKGRRDRAKCKNSTKASSKSKVN